MIFDINEFREEKALDISEIKEMLEKLVISNVRTNDGKYKLTKINECNGEVKIVHETISQISIRLHVF